MSCFGELLQVNSEQAYNFFLENLAIQVRPASQSEFDETYYVASILAHYAETPRYSAQPLATDLSEIFDRFVVSKNAIFPRSIDAYPGALEFAGAQVLFVNGFFREWMERRHNVRWYDGIGQSFYDRASKIQNDPKRKAVLKGVAFNFYHWTFSCRDLHRSLRQKEIPIF